MNTKSTDERIMLVWRNEQGSLWLVAFFVDRIRLRGQDEGDLEEW